MFCFYIYFFCFTGFYDLQKWNLNEEWQTDLQLFSTNTIFVMWVVVYLGQIIWLLYCVELTFQRSDKDEMLCTRPGPVPLNTMVFLVLALGMSAVWSAMMDKPNLWSYSLLILLAVCTCAYLSLGTALHQLHRCHDYMYTHGYNAHTWLIRLFVHNAVGVYASWVTVMFLYYCTVMLHHYDKASGDVCRYLMVGLLAAFILIWFILDCFLIRAYSRGLVLPYVIHIIALGMIIRERRDDKDTPYLMATVVMVITIVFFLIKVAITIGSRLRPMMYEDRHVQRVQRVEIPAETEKPTQ